VLPIRARFYLAVDILKFGLLFKFRPAVRRGAKFKKRKQIFFRTSACAVKAELRFKFMSILKFCAARKFKAN